jgi:hypothetical protein
VPLKYDYYGDGGICRYIANVKDLRSKSTKCGILVLIYTIIYGSGNWDFEERRNSKVSFNFKVEKLEISNNLL